MDDIARIAKGLTEAQRFWIIQMKQPQGAGKWPVQNSLVDKGLASYFPWSFTDLGQSVRAYLMENG